MLEAPRFRGTSDTYRETLCCLGKEGHILILPIPGQEPCRSPFPPPGVPAAGTALPRPYLSILRRLSFEPGSECVSQPRPTAICSSALFPSAPHNLSLTDQESEARCWESPFQGSPGQGCPIPAVSTRSPHLCRSRVPPTPHGCPRARAPGEESKLKALVSELFNVAVGDPGTGAGPREHCGIW